MRFKIANLKVSNGTDKKGKPWTLFNFINQLDGLSYSSFLSAGNTDAFAVGYEFEADITEKPDGKGGMYRNIQWPKAVGYGTGRNSAALQQPSDSSIHAKLDEILRVVNFLADLKVIDHDISKTKENIKKAAELPYSDTPPPNEEDFPGF